MSSELKVNSIRDTSNNEALTISSGNVSFNNTLSAGTIGGNVVFPDGIITNTTVKKYAFDTNTTYSHQTTSEKIFTRESDTSTTVSSFTAKQGHTYIINMIYYGYISLVSGSSSSRYGVVGMYYGTTSRSQGDTTVDTKLHGSIFGRNINSSSAAFASHSGSYNMVGSFYQSGSDQTIYYYGTSYHGSTNKIIEMYMSSTYPGYDIIYEIKGNKLTTET